MHSSLFRRTRRCCWGNPDAQILSFDNSNLHEISYEETQPMQIVRHFVNHRDEFLAELFQESGRLFDE